MKKMKFTDTYEAFSLYQKSLGACSDHSKMISVMKKIMLKELTEKQKTCLALRCENGMKVTDVAERLGVNASTVTRHVQKAKKRIREVMGYYGPWNSGS